jgi:HEAT repeat protein
VTSTEGERPPAAGAGEEEETPKTSGARLALRFFLVPLLVVVTAVGIFLLVNVMTFERRTARDYLSEVRGGSASRRWQAAFELSRTVGNMSPGPEREAFVEETLRVLEEVRRHPDEDPRVRRYLVLVLGRLGEPAAAEALRSAAADPDVETRLYAVWALGMIGDRDALETILKASASEDAGERKIAAYVMGRLGRPEAIPRLRVLLGDRVTDVRWNAAIALASLGDREGVPVLRAMIDRDALARQATLSADQAETAMIGALKALALLRDTESLPSIDAVAAKDPNLRVREAAREAAAATRGASSRLEPCASVLVV